MLRKLVVILTMLLCSMATQLYALGLGTVTVESSLNQPLRMRIELIQLGDTRLQDVRVSMASGDDFQRFNVDRAGFLSNVRFSIEATSQGNVVILTSSQIVREPYLSFILDTRWPNGRLLSEHTILLDLPVFNDQQAPAEVRQPISPVLQRPATDQPAAAAPFVDTPAAPAVTAPSSSSSAANLQPEVITAEPEAEPVEAEVAEQPEPEVAAAPEPEQAVETVAASDEVAEEAPVAEEAIEAEVVPEQPQAIEAAAEPVAPEPETIETDGSDTLSDIALQVRPNTTVTMQQTMLALQELNPDAFADGNINRLRSGQVLRVPTLQEIQSIDPRDAVAEVSRQNQEFAEADVQPLAAPTTVAADQDDQPQGQLSVVSSDDAIDASSGSSELRNAENAELDQRIAELEAQLAQRQEEADRARIEREELDSRMADLEAQIAAAQEIIRLQDIQLAQLQDSLAAAAAEAQLLADQQAIQLAAEAEAAQPVGSPTSLFDDVLRILTGNSIFMIFGIALVILLLVVLMLRRNRAAKSDEHDIDEIADQEFEDEESGSDDDVQAKTDTEFQDYDPSDLDSELDDIIGVADESQREEDDDDTQQLDVIGIVEKLVAEQQYRRALSMLNTSLQQQGESEEVREKIAEIENLLAVEEAEQRKIDEASREREAASRASETKSFLDDLGIDLDSFDYDEDSNEPAAAAAKDEPARVEKPVEPVVEDDSDNMDMMFDLGGDDDEPGVSSADDSDDAESADEVEAFEFDLDDDTSEAVSEAKDPEDLDIDTLEFDAGAADELKSSAAAAQDEEIELETFSFDADAASSLTKAAEAEKESSEEEADSNAVEFSFDSDDLADTAEAPKPASNEEVETFDFDLDDNAGDTILEKPDTAITSREEDDADEFDFDLDEFEVDTAATDSATSATDDDFLDFDAEPGVAETEKNAAKDDDFEFDLDDDDEPAKSVVADDASDSLDDDDLEFLSDDDVEIESVDDIEEIDMLSDDDETATKLELAYAYQKMGDSDGAKEILQEVIKEGSDEQIAEATKLLGTLDSKSD